MMRGKPGTGNARKTGVTQEKNTSASKLLPVSTIQSIEDFTANIKTGYNAKQQRYIPD